MGAAFYIRADIPGERIQRGLRIDLHRGSVDKKRGLNDGARVSIGKFDQHLEISQWFWQEPVSGDRSVYWLSIVAVYAYEGGPSQPPTPAPRARAHPPGAPRPEDLTADFGRMEKTAD